MRKCQEAAEAETIFTGTTKNTLEQTEALEKHVKTVTMRAEALASTEADFFKTHRTPRRSTEAPERTRSAAEPAKHSHPFHARKTAQRRKKKQAHAWSTKFVVFSYIMSESKRVVV